MVDPLGYRRYELRAAWKSRGGYTIWKLHWSQEIERLAFLVDCHCMTAMSVVINSTMDYKQVTRHTKWDADSVALVRWVSLAPGYLRKPP